MMFGNGTTADTNTLYFSAGPANENHGLFGKIVAVRRRSPNGTAYGDTGCDRATATGSPTPPRSDAQTTPRPRS